MQLPCCLSMNSNFLFQKLVYEVSSNEQENFSWKSFCRVRKFDSSALPSLYNLHWDRIYAHIQLIFPQRFYLVVRAETINDLNLMNQWQALPTQEVLVRHTSLKSSLKVALPLQPPPNKLSFSGLLEKVIRFPNPLVGHRRS